MRSEAYICVECDNCGAVEEITLHVTARGNYTKDGVDEELERLGWRVVRGGEEYCEEWAKEEGDR